MEMKKMELEREPLDSAAGPSSPMLGTKTEELKKEDSKTYCKLKRPSEDVYSEATFSLPAVKPPCCKKRERVLVALCVFLGVICLGLLIGILLKGNSSDCPKQPQPLKVFKPSDCPKQPQPLKVFKPSDFPKQPQAPKVPKSSDCCQCPEDWELFGNTCFFFSKKRLNWTSSRTFCHKAIDGDLAVLSNQTIRAFVLEKSMGLDHWIGLHYDSRWEWTNNQLASEPPEGVGMCVTLNVELTRNECSAYAHYICQQPAVALPLRPPG